MAIPIAIQLYTVRDYCAKDFLGTLRQIAEIGYQGVEFAGVYGMAPNELKQKIDEIGLQPAGAHVPMLTKDNLAQILEEYLPLGVTRFATSKNAEGFETADAAKATADEFNQAAELLKPHGIEFGCHNHWWEFADVGGQTGYDVFMANTYPSVFAELDVYWTAESGQDPKTVLEKYQSRAALLHIKDGHLQTRDHQVAVGSGKLDMPAIIGAADPAVTDWLIVELDACQTDMMEAVRASYAYLTENGLAQGRV